MMPHAISADPVRSFVLDGIASGRLKPQQKLPTERQLADQFGQPRSAVRKALTILEAEGRIMRHVGRGTFILALDKEMIVAPDASPAELIEARIAFEPTLVPLVASAARTLDDYERQDDAFHLAIAQATHNSLLIRTAEMLSTARHNAAWGFLKQRRGTFEPERRAQVRAEHQGILDALKERDIDLARDRLRAHLTDVRLNLFGR